MESKCEGLEVDEEEREARVKLKVKKVRYGCVEG